MVSSYKWVENMQLSPLSPETPIKKINNSREVYFKNPQGQNSGQRGKLWRLENKRRMGAGLAIMSKLILNHSWEIQETNFYHPNPQKAQVLPYL